VDDDAEFTLGDATLSVSFEDGGNLLDVVFAGDGFSSIGAPPEAIDLESDAPSYCD